MTAQHQPCPFCGSTLLEVELDDHAELARVVCQGCDGAGPTASPVELSCPGCSMDYVDADLCPFCLAELPDVADLVAALAWQAWDTRPAGRAGDEK